MTYKAPITPELIKLGQGAYTSYKFYLEKEKLAAEQAAAQKAAEIKNKAEQEALLKNLEKERQTVKNLENDLKIAQKEYTNAREDAESMQIVLKDAISKNAKTIIIKETMNSLDRLREKEKDQRVKVDNLQNTIRRKSSSILENQTVTKKGVLNNLIAV